MWPALLYNFIGSVGADEGPQVTEQIPEGGPSPDVNIPGLDGKLPSAEQLLEMLDSMTGISDEEKASLKADLLRNVQEHAAAGAQAAAMQTDDLTTQTIILLSLLGLVALIFVFFVYKLFKCLQEREMKREEKKKNKQLKKKK